MRWDRLRCGGGRAARARPGGAGQRAGVRLRLLPARPGLPDRLAQPGRDRAAAPRGREHRRRRVASGASLDGRFLVFTRMKLLPKLNGDIPVPAQRSLVWVDLQTGTSPTSRPARAARGRRSRRAGRAAISRGGSRPTAAAPRRATRGSARSAAAASSPSFGFPFYTTLSSAADVYFPQVASSRNAFSEPLVNNPAAAASARRRATCATSRWRRSTRPAAPRQPHDAAGGLGPEERRPGVRPSRCRASTCRAPAILRPRRATTTSP